MELRPIFEDDSEYLEHYGVLGMKWGVRNAETLRKYAGGATSSVKRKVKTEYSDYKARRAVKAERARKVRNRSTLSDKELNKLSDRLQREKRLKSLHEENDRPGRTSARNAGKSAASKAARVVVGGLAVGAAGYGASKLVRNASVKEYISPELEKALLDGLKAAAKKK